MGQHCISSSVCTSLCYIIFLMFDFDDMKEISNDEKQIPEVVTCDIFPSLRICYEDVYVINSKQLY